jgi:hypothetical protein
LSTVQPPAEIKLLASGGVELNVPALGINAQFPAGTTTVNSGGSSVQLDMTTLSYTKFGSWERKDAAGRTTDIGMISGGYNTPNDAPRSGTAVYSGTNNVSGRVFTSAGQAKLSGDASFTVTFESRRIQGDLKNMKATDAAGSVTPWNNVAIEATTTARRDPNNFLNNVLTLTGASSAASAEKGPYTLKPEAKGWVDGGFYGPDAEEISGVWTLNDGTKGAFGTFGAKRQ